MKGCEHFIESLNLRCSQLGEGRCLVLWEAEINRGKAKKFSLENAASVEYVAEKAVDCGNPRTRMKIISSAERINLRELNKNK